MSEFNSLPPAKLRDRLALHSDVFGVLGGVVTVLSFIPILANWLPWPWWLVPLSVGATLICIYIFLRVSISNDEPLQTLGHIEPERLPDNPAPAPIPAPVAEIVLCPSPRPALKLAPPNLTEIVPPRSVLAEPKTRHDLLNDLIALRQEGIILFQKVVEAYELESILSKRVQDWEVKTGMYLMDYLGVADTNEFLSGKNIEVYQPSDEISRLPRRFTYSPEFVNRTFTRGQRLKRIIAGIQAGRTL